MTNSSEIKPAVIFHVVMVIWAAGLAALFGAGAFSMFSGDPLAVAYIVGAVLALLSWLSAVSLLKHVFCWFAARSCACRLTGFFALLQVPLPRVLCPPFPAGGAADCLGGLPRLPHGERLAESGGADLQEPGHRIDRAVDRIWLDDVPARRGDVAKGYLGLPATDGARPARESARVAQFLSLLFRQPKTFPGPHIRRFEVIAAVTASALCGLLLYLQFNKEEPNVRGAIYAMAGTTVLVCVVGFPLQIRRMRAQRFIQLSAAGIAVGPEERSARVIAWSDILLVRVHIGSVSTPGTRLELRLANGDTFFIRDFREAAQLASLIDPPADKVQAAWQLIAKGATAEDAAREVGLSVM